MKITYSGFLTFNIAYDKVIYVTDPIALMRAGLKKNQFQADVCLISESDFYGKSNVLDDIKDLKITAINRPGVFEVSNPGEYEIGGVILRRLGYDGVYILDEGYLRIVYMGMIHKDFDINELKDLGDVDTLILPVGDGDIFPSYEKLEKIIEYVDPSILIPSGYQIPGLKSEYSSLKTLDEFAKHMGFTNIREEKTLKLESRPEVEQKTLEVISIKADL